jgi:diguanylate cyclase (GGDEF)-like protein
MNLRIGAGMLLLLLPVAYSAHELWLQREESLPLRAGVLTLLAIQALLMLHRAYFSLMHLNIPEPTLKVAPWTEAMMLDFMGLMLVFSFTIIAFVKDQSLRQQCTIARCDVLTGVGNRFYFEETLRRHFRRAQIAGQSLALIMADADGFKQYNDLYGHPAGDRCLRVIATALTGACRPSDTVGRYGGEEFAVLLPNTSIDAALTVAQRMLTRVRELNLEHTGNPQGFVSISLGVAAFIPSSQETTAEDLVEAADHALYRAKREGRDRVCSGTQTHQSAIWATQS